MLVLNLPRISPHRIHRIDERKSSFWCCLALEASYGSCFKSYAATVTAVATQRGFHKFFTHIYFSLKSYSIDREILNKREINQKTWFKVYMRISFLDDDMGEFLWSIYCKKFLGRILCCNSRDCFFFKHGYMAKFISTSLKKRKCFNSNLYFWKVTKIVQIRVPDIFWLQWLPKKGIQFTP